MDFPNGELEVDAAGLPVDELIVVRAEQRRAADLARMLRQGFVPLGDGPVTRALLASGAWRRVAEESYAAFLSADVDVFRRAASG